jgi:hypothetical protein
LSGHTVKNVPEALKLEAAHYFGGLEKAIAALNKENGSLAGTDEKS